MKKTVRRASFILLLAGASALAALPAAQTPAPKEPLRIPRLATAPKIDGVLDNPIWETGALKIENFIQLAPKENGVPDREDRRLPRLRREEPLHRLPGLRFPAVQGPLLHHQARRLH